MEFFGHASAANSRSTFEDDWLQTSFGEIERRHQAIVPAADNDDVLLFCQGYVELKAALPPHMAVRLCLTVNALKRFFEATPQASRRSLDKKFRVGSESRRLSTRCCGQAPTVAL